MKNRYYNTFSIGETIINAIKYNAKNRNFHDERILLNWKYIFKDFANFMQPCKIVFSGIQKDVIQKTLYVTTNNRNFATEFIFYKKQLLSMLNEYFGSEKSIFIDLKLKILDI